VQEDINALRARVKQAIVKRFWKSDVAGDTASGIHTSWLTDMSLEAATPELVADVLEELVDQEILLKQHVTGGSPLFRRGPKFPYGKRGH
jgi:hypothetical protein